MRSPIMPLCLFVAFVIGCWNIIVGVVSRWFVFDESYSHGLLLAALSVYMSGLAYRETRPQPGFFPIWLVPLILGVAAYVIGGIMLLEALQFVALIPLLMSALAVIWGWRQSVPFIIPVGILIFTVPFWDYLSWPLQNLTVYVNDIWLGWLGIQFRVDGVFVYLTNIGAFEVAGGCSGLRYLLVGMSLTAIYGQLNYQLWRNRILLFVVSIGVALLANWLRVFVIFQQGYVTKMQSPLVHNHEFFGWVLFGVMLIPLFWFANRLERGEPSQPVCSQVAARSDSQSRFALPAGIITVLILLSPSPLVAVLSANAAMPSDLSQVPRFLSGSDWAPYYERKAINWEPVIK
ncbi:MAG: exosortase, partial [Thiohalomonadales bacterium]|nr:exosortase [Thiohalomonadales bacterium]